MLSGLLYLFRDHRVLVSVAANLQKIVDEPQTNRNVTFKLVRRLVVFVSRCPPQKAALLKRVSGLSRPQAWKAPKFPTM